MIPGPLLTFALDMSGNMVSINNVERGMACNCRCPQCNEPLVAKPGNGGRQPHFAHKKGSDCQGSYMTALHLLAEQIIQQEKAVMVPAYKNIKEQRLVFTKIEVEQRVERKDLQPDIVGETEDGVRWFLEIKNTHKVDEAKKAKIKESNITCLEIDVSEQKLENLKDFLLQSTSNREWINNPAYDSRIVEAKRKSVSRIEELFFTNKTLTIPLYASSKYNKIGLKDVKLLTKSEDGLYAIIKVISSDDTPYIFKIGSTEILETMEVSPFQEIECNQLAISTDYFLFMDDIALDPLHMKWHYHYVTEKERENELREYRVNPDFEVKNEEDCYTHCIYHPFDGKCIYLERIITQRGANFVVCNSAKRLKNETKSETERRERGQYSNSDYSNESYYPGKKMREENHLKIPSIQHKNEELELFPKNELLPENLSKDKKWTIDEYYKHLLSTKSNGLSNGIVKCQKVKDDILVLEEEVYGGRNLYPFHIVYISVNNGDIIRNKVADFTSESKAISAYNERLGKS